MANTLQVSFGIDFGTTKSSASFYIKDDKRLIHCGESDNKPLSSAVTINKITGETVVGETAIAAKMAWKDQAEYIHSIKMKMDQNWSINVAGREWHVEDIASKIFDSLKQIIESDTEYLFPLRNAVVAIPVGFSADKRRKIRLAAKNAGIKIDSFISEPTAAFFANYEELKNAETIAVFDWGGGTLDICVLKHDNGKIEELASKCIAMAGDDIDLKLAKTIHKIVAPRVKFEDVPEVDRVKLIKRVEVTKCELASDDEAFVMLPRYMNLKNGIFEKLKYGYFSSLIEPEIKRAIACLEETIEESQLNYANIDKFLFVGGSCNLRPLQEMLFEKFGEDFAEKVCLPDEMDWNVSEGAAILASKKGCYYSNQSVGIIMSDGNYFELLPKNKNVSNWNKVVHFGITDQSREARFVFSGSPDIDKSPDRCKVFEVTAKGFLQEQIVLKAEIDNDLVFRVSAQSTYSPKDIQEVWWQYSNLKYYYKLW